MKRNLAKKMMLVAVIAVCTVTVTIPVFASEVTDNTVVIKCDFPEKKEI